MPPEDSRCQQLAERPGGGAYTWACGLHVAGGVASELSGCFCARGAGIPKWAGLDKGGAMVWAGRDSGRWAWHIRDRFVVGVVNSGRGFFVGRGSREDSLLKALEAFKLRIGGIRVGL